MLVVCCELLVVVYQSLVLIALCLFGYVVRCCVLFVV